MCGCMVKKTPATEKSSSSSGCLLAQDFFGGKIRDRTTKQSRKAADDLAMLKSKHKNPGWQPMNAKGCKVNLNSINVAKARAMVKDAVPGSVVDSLLQGQQEPLSAQEHGAFARNNPIEADVRREINRRIQALSESGQIFEDHAAYNNSEKDAEDARLIIQGKDPAAADAARRGDRFVVYRAIPVERRHWVAAMQGIRHMQGVGWAYVHTDGSVTMLQKGRDVKCRCGALHPAV